MHSVKNVKHLNKPQYTVSALNITGTGEQLFHLMAECENVNLTTHWDCVF